MRDARTWVDDTKVTLSFYGSIVYLAVVSTLDAQRDQPPPAVAISAVIATGTVLYVAHVFASLVPKAAKAGRLEWAHLGAALRHDLPLLVSTVVPTIPLLLATWGVVSSDTGYRMSVRLTMVMLFALTLTLSRLGGLSWVRSIVAGLAITGIALTVAWLEAQVH